jgi:hypothetical protein
MLTPNQLPTRCERGTNRLRSSPRCGASFRTVANVRAVRGPEHRRAKRNLPYPELPPGLLLFARLTDGKSCPLRRGGGTIHADGQPA